MKFKTNFNHKIKMFNNSKYSNHYDYYDNKWKMYDQIQLKNENFYLKTELDKFKKQLQSYKNKDKTELKVQQFTAPFTSDTLCLRHPLPEAKGKTTIQPQIPDDIETLLEQIGDVQLKNKLHLKLKNLLLYASCIVCNASTKSVLFLECRHLVICKKCSTNLGNSCPLCRKLSKKIEIYH